MRISDWSSDVCSSDLISFKYQIFGPPAAPDRRQSWEQGIHFAYTQRMFWDLVAKSSPFRNIDFMPELFYLAPTMAFRSGVSLGGQGGFRHESNGRSGAGSRSLNTIYVQRSEEHTSELQSLM